jgi:uncharacterized protein YjiS (DUF1127 family)
MYSEATSAPTDAHRWLRDRIGSFFAALRAHDQTRRELNRLSQMPDSMLKDIGLTRGDLRRIRRNKVHYF